MHIQSDTLLQNREQNIKYNDFKKVLLVWESWGKKKGLF